MSLSLHLSVCVFLPPLSHTVFDLPPLAKPGSHSRIRSITNPQPQPLLSVKPHRGEGEIAFFPAFPALSPTTTRKLKVDRGEGSELARLRIAGFIWNRDDSKRGC